MPNTQPPKHKPNEKHTLDEVLKSLNDLVRGDVLDKSATPSTPTPAPAPKKKAAAPADKTDMSDILKSLESLLDDDLNPNAKPAPAPKPAAPPAVSSPPPAPPARKTKPADTEKPAQKNSSAAAAQADRAQPTAGRNNGASESAKEFTNVAPSIKTEPPSAMSDVLSEADLVKALEEISFDADVEPEAKKPEPNVEADDATLGAELDSITFDEISVESPAIESTPAAKTSSGEIELADLAPASAEETGLSIDTPNVSELGAIEIEMEAAPPPADAGLEFAEEETRAAPDATISTLSVDMPRTANVETVEDEIQAAPPPADAGLEFTEDEISAAPPSGALEFVEDLIDTSKAPAADNKLALEEAKSALASIADELASIDFSVDDLEPARTAPKDSFSVDFTPSKKSNPAPVVEKAKTPPTQERSETVTKKADEVKKSPEKIADAVTQSELLLQEEINPPPVDPEPEEPLLVEAPVVEAPIVEDAEPIAEEIEAAAPVEEIEATTPVVEEIEATITEEVDAAPPVEEVAQEIAIEAPAPPEEPQESPIVHTSDMIEHAAELSTLPMTDDVSDIIERAEPPTMSLGGGKDLGKLGEFMELDLSSSDSVDFSSSSLVDIGSEPAAQSTPPPAEAKKAQPTAPKKDSTTIDLDAPASAPAPSPAPVATAPTPTSAPRKEKIAAAPKPVPAEKQKNIPVLKNVAVAPADDFTLDFSPPTNPPEKRATPKKPDAASQELHHATVQVVAKLNIELRKSGKPPLDAKAINRLQQLLKEALQNKTK